MPTAFPALRPSSTHLICGHPVPFEFRFHENVETRNRKSRHKCQLQTKAKQGLKKAIAKMWRIVALLQMWPFAAAWFECQKQADFYQAKKSLSGWIPPNSEDRLRCEPKDS